MLGSSSVAEQPTADLGAAEEPANHPAPRGARPAGWLGAGLGSLLTAFDLIGPGLADTFHYGEYFVAEVTLRRGSPAGTPLTIHGGLDYLPAQLNRAAFGADHYLFTTWLTLALCSVAAALIAVEILTRICPSVRGSRTLLFTAGLVGGLTLGYRELALVLGVLVFLMFRRATRRPARAWLALAGGALVTAGLVWCWNRGLIGVAALGGGYALSLRAQREAVLAAVGAVVPAAALVATSDLYSPGVVSENIRVLLDGGEIWRYPWTAGVVVLAAVLGIALLAGSWSLAHLARSAPAAWRPADVWLWGLLSLGFAKTAFDRLDVDHLVVGVVVPVGLLAAAGPGAWAERKVRRAGVVLFVTAALLVAGAQPLVGSVDVLVVMVVLCTVWHLVRSPRPRGDGLTAASAARPAALVVLTVLLAAQAVAVTRSGGYDWVSYVEGLPSSSDTLPDDVEWVADRLHEHGATCIVDLTNSGLVNAAADLPTCTPYGYLVWVPPTRQDELIAHIREAGPPAVVWSTEHWMYAIDDRSMTERYPELTAWVEQEYPVLECDLGYCVASRSGLD